MDKKVNGANIYKVSWEDRRLKVYFHNGAVIMYKDVPQAVYEGIITAVSVGSFLNRLVINEFDIEVVEEPDLITRNKILEHHKDTTVGLWAMDKPELIPENIKHLFFQIDFQEFKG